MVMPVDLDLLLVRSFLALCDEKSFRRAATDLHVTPSALTKRIQRLEHQLGVALAERDASGDVVLTHAGHRFAHEGRVLMRQAGTACDVARRPNRREMVRLGLPRGHQSYFVDLMEVTGVQEQLRLWHPQVGVVVSSVPFDAYYAALLNNTVDLLWSPAAVTHPELASHPLGLASARTVIVGPGHPLAQRTSVSVDEVVNEHLLINPTIPPELMRPMWLGDLRGQEEASLVRCSANDFRTAALGTLDGHAAIVSLQLGAALPDGRLRAVPIGDAPPVVFHLLRRRTDRRPWVLDILETLVTSSWSQTRRPFGPSSLAGD
jgi:DNA-binding transcriptional LysR family regulator